MILGKTLPPLFDWLPGELKGVPRSLLDRIKGPATTSVVQ